MRKFNVLIKHKGNTLAYENLEGQKAIKLMESLIKRGFRVLALTESFGVTEKLTIKQMKGAVL